MPVTETGGCRFMSVAVDHGRDGRWRCGETSFIKHRPRRKMYRRYLGSQYRCYNIDVYERYIDVS